MFERFSLHKRLLEVEERFAKLQREFNALQLEWNDTLERLNRMSGRIAKRAQAAQEREDAMMGIPPRTETDEAGEARGVLSPAQQRAQASVLARRHKLNGGT